MLESEPDPPNFDSMNALAQRSPDPAYHSHARDTPTPINPPDSSTSDSLQASLQHSPSSTTSTSRQSRRSLAGLARDKTSSALASLTSISTVAGPSLRSATSSGSLAKHTGLGLLTRPTLPKSAASATEIPPRRSGTPRPEGGLTQRSGTPAMARSDNSHGRMHQTSSKVLRTTDDDRPFTKDFKDLFATLITSLPLTPHRVRFSRVEETFLSEEAITNLGSLKFSQSNRIPDPKNPARWVVTTTTTTFSMAKEMARSVCQRFLDARLIESAESKSITTYTMKGGVWQLTPKGMGILSRFCLQNGINARHVEPLIRREQMHIVNLERDSVTDRLSQDKSTVEVIFRRFAGTDGPNVKSNVQISDSDSVSEYASGLVGVKMARERRLPDRVVTNSFTGKATSDWLMDCCTTVDRRETFEIAETFVKWGLMVSVLEDKAYVRDYPPAKMFQPTKAAIYTMTERGQRICGWLARDPSISSTDSRELPERLRIPKDSNTARLHNILLDPALRLMFREFLRLSLCEENMTFYQDVKDFTHIYRQLDQSGRLERPDAVRETLGQAYGIYNAFLASGAPSELNIDHSLRNKLDNRMIRTDNGEEAMRVSLDEVVELFELAQVSVFKLMASDSVPKFMRDPRYASVLREHEWDLSSSNRAFSPAPPGASEHSIHRSSPASSA